MSTDKEPMKLEDLQNGAGGDIWGIDADGCITVGYDNRAEQAGPGHACPDWWGVDEYDLLPTAEKLRLANIMIDRWKRYRVAVIEKEGLTSSPTKG